MTHKFFRFFVALTLICMLFMTGVSLAEGDELIIDAQSFQGMGDIDALSSDLSPAVIRVTNGEIPADAMRALMQKYPDAAYEWSFTMYGQRVDSAMEFVDLGSEQVRDYEELTAYLDCLPNLTKFDMYSTIIDKARMDELSQRYPAIRFGWTFKIDTYTLRTDITAFSTEKGNREPYYKTKDFEVLVYCKDLVALDLGHNHIDDITFLENFPGMKILILADNDIADISVLEKLTELEYVELFMNEITDISPLANHEKLVDLNLCYNKIADPSPLYTMQHMERLWISMNGMKQALKDEIAANMPDTYCEFYVKLSTQGGWRSHPHYYTMIDIFNTRTYRPWDE